MHNVLKKIILQVSLITVDLLLILFSLFVRQIVPKNLIPQNHKSMKFYWFLKCYFPLGFQGILLTFQDLSTVSDNFFILSQPAYYFEVYTWPMMILALLYNNIALVTVLLVVEYVIFIASI